MYTNLTNGAWSGRIISFGGGRTQEVKQPLPEPQEIINRSPLETNVQILLRIDWYQQKFSHIQ